MWSEQREWPWSEGGSEKRPENKGLEATILVADLIGWVGMRERVESGWLKIVIKMLIRH